MTLDAKAIDPDVIRITLANATETMTVDVSFLDATSMVVAIQKAIEVAAVAEHGAFLRMHAALRNVR